MPTFEIFQSIPGVTGPASFTLGTDQATTLQVQLNDPLLFMPKTMPPVTVRAAFIQESSILTLEFQLTQPLKLLNDYVELTALELKIRTGSAVGGARGVDLQAASPVTAIGSAAVVNDVAVKLGIPGNRLPLEVSYILSQKGKSGFQLMVTNTPIALHRVYALLQSAEVGIEALPTEAAIVLFLKGDVAVESEGQQKIKGILDKIFGGSQPDLDPPPFVYRQKFRLSAAGLPDVPIGPPTFRILPSWPGGLPPSFSTLQGTSISLGSPQFTFQLPDLGQPLQLPEFEIRNCSIAFPRLPELAAFRLDGHLRYFQVDSTQFRFEILPSSPGGIDLPEILRFFLARIEWLGGRLPDLFDAEDVMRQTQTELEWAKLFEGLLTDLDLATLKNALLGIINSALAIPGAPSLQRLFELAFYAMQSGASQVFAVLLDVWFVKNPNALDKLVMLLQSLMPTLRPENFAILLEKLFAIPNLPIGQLIEQALKFGADQIGSDLSRFLGLWVQLLAAATRTVDPDVLARAVLDLLMSLQGNLATLQDLVDLRLPNVVVTLPTLRMPLGFLFVGLGFSSLSWSTGITADQVNTQAVLRLLGSPYEALMNALRLILPKGPLIDAATLDRLFLAFVTNADGKPQEEIIILRLGRIFPLGILMALAGAVYNLTKPLPWWRMWFKCIEEDPSVKTRRLPAPGTPRPAGESEPGAGPGINTTKYLIFSDIHRDAKSDDRGLMQFGSINHFSENDELYCKLLDYAKDKGYTVIEAGDCEELWFIRDFNTYLGPKDTLEQVIASHPGVYERLAALHAKNRYFRIYGNHDSYLRDSSVSAPVRQRFNAAAPGFEIYDYFVIPGVKTMDDLGIGDLLGDVWAGLTAEDKVAALVQRITEGRLGLDSRPYEERKPLIVAHGHEWDFWNCDSNSLVGKLFANSVGVPLDQINDPITDVQGIAFQGSPLLDLRSVLAALPVFNNFPTYEPARQFAHEMQHRAEKTRTPIDDIMYVESLTAAMGLFMPLNVTEPNGTVRRKWSEAISGAPFVLPKMLEHLGNMLCVGHTHYPQSQPYFNIEELILGPLKPLVDVVRQMVGELLFGVEPSLNVIKTHYFNSGTAGWMEGVIWAIEIDETGQAKLVFWTKDTLPDRPQTMDWELLPIAPQLKAAIETKKQELTVFLRDQLPKLQLRLSEALGSSRAADTLPVAALVAYADELTAQPVSIVLQNPPVTDISGVIDEAVRTAEQEIARLKQFVLQVMLAALRRQEGSSVPKHPIELVLPVTSSIEDELKGLEGTLGAVPSLGSVDSTFLACGSLFARYTVPLAYGGGKGLTSLIDAQYPVLYAALSMLLLLPRDQQVGNTHVKTSVALQFAQLKIRVEVG